MRWLDTLLRRPVAPPGSTGALADAENILAVAPTGAGHLVATRLGLWVPGASGPSRTEWHLVSTARWDGATLALVVAEQTGTAGAAVLLTDVHHPRFALPDPGNVPQVVQQRVTATVRSAHYREFAGGGAWFVQRSMPGRDGVHLQVRVDPGTDLEVVREVAAAVADQLPRPGSPPR